MAEELVKQEKFDAANVQVTFQDDQDPLTFGGDLRLSSPMELNSKIENSFRNTRLFRYILIFSFNTFNQYQAAT